MMYGCNPSTWKVETGGLIQFEASLGYIVKFSLKEQNTWYYYNQEKKIPIAFHYRSGTFCFLVPREPDLHRRNDLREGMGNMSDL